MKADRRKQTTAPMLVTGGTGNLGSQVVERLRAQAGPVRVLSRHVAENKDGVEYVAGDLATGAGIDDAVRGVEVVVHCAGSAKGDDDKARHLTAAASRAGVRHLVYISVVGADRIPMAGRVDRVMFGYFGAKHEAERIVAGSGLAWTTLRATQFYELTFQTVEQMAKLPIVPVPSGFRFQPIDSGEVADRLVQLALGAPAGLVGAMAGPGIHEMAELVRSYLRAAKRRPRPILSLPMPGKAAAAFRDGANLAPDRAVGRRTWEEFLADRLGSPATAVSAGGRA